VVPENLTDCVLSSRNALSCAEISNYYCLFGRNIVFGRGGGACRLSVSTVLTDGAVMGFISFPLTRLE
jgi:hypothetical protein